VSDIPTPNLDMFLDTAEFMLREVTKLRDELIIRPTDEILRARAAALDARIRSQELPILLELRRTL
jgi:hypothetical protein